MKWVLHLVFFTVLAFSGSLQAQDGTLTAPKRKEIKTTEAVKVKPSPITIEGIVAQVFKNKQPLQLINPLAPAKYGSGDQNLSRDPVTGRPEGFIVLGIQW